MSRLAVSLILVAALSAGCIENMGDLKEALGVREPAPPEPVYSPPLAKAQANATLSPVGAPLRFVGDGSKDPQGLALTYSWDFGDSNRGEGPIVTHVYASPGQYLVRLTVTNAAGLKDTDQVALRVSPSDLEPTVAMRVLDAAGMPVASAMMGESLSFEALGTDPEGGPLSYDWDFGDGAVSHDGRATHAYAKPGSYEVRVSATDRAGNVASATTRILVDGAWSESGAFAAAGADTAEFVFPVATGAREVAVALSYAGNFGLNDLEIVLVAPTGEEVVRSDATPPPGAQDAQTRELTVPSAQLAAGDWTVRVVREKGLNVEWSLDVRETFSRA